MTQWERYQRRERRKARLMAAGAWALVILAGIGIAVVAWLALVGFVAVFG